MYESSAFEPRFGFRSLVVFLALVDTASEVHVVPDSVLWNRGSRILQATPCRTLYGRIANETFEGPWYLLPIVTGSDQENSKMET